MVKCPVLSPAAQSPADVLRRIRELAAESGQPVTDQHVISQVILARFRAAAGPDKCRNDRESRSTSDSASTEDVRSAR